MLRIRSYLIRSQLSSGVSRMPMRLVWSIAPLVALIGCGAEAITHSQAPSTPTLTGTVRTVPDLTGNLAVEVSAHVRNATPKHFHLGAGPSCPLYVKMLPNWSPDATLILGFPPPCPASAFTMDLAPGDSTVLNEFFPASAFASLPPMIDGFAVGFAFDGGSVTIFAGSIPVPLGRATSAAPANVR
jgi:hypothetical protein